MCEESFLGEDLILLRLPPKGNSCGGKSFSLIPYTHKNGISSIRAVELDACRCLSHKRCLFTVSVLSLDSLVMLGLPATYPCAEGGLGGMEGGQVRGDGDEV